MKEMSPNKLNYGLALVLLLVGGAELASLCEAATPAAPEDPLPPGAIGRLGTLRFRHREPVKCIVLGADGTSILSLAGKLIYVWDLATGKERRRFAEHKTPVNSFACSRDGKLLASGCGDGTIHVWDVATGRELRHFTAHDMDKSVVGWGEPVGILYIDFTPDGRHVISQGSDGAIRLWDAASSKLVREFGRFRTIGRASLAPDGKILACVVIEDETIELRIWEVATGRERKRRPPPGKTISFPTFSPDSRILAVCVSHLGGAQLPEIQLWDAKTAKEIRTLRRHKSWARCTFAPDGKTLVSWSDAGNSTARLWDVSTGKEIRRISPDRPVSFTDLLFCPDGQTLVSFSQGGRGLQLWDRASGKEVRLFKYSISTIDNIHFSANGRRLAVGERMGLIRLWDVAAQKEIRILEQGGRCVCFSPDGSRLATVDWIHPQARIWDVISGKLLRRIPTKNKGAKPIAAMAWSGDNKVLATWSREDHLFRLWNIDTGRQLRELSPGVDRHESLMFSPDGKILAAFVSAGPSLQLPHLLLWAVDTGRLLHSLKVSLPGRAKVSSRACMAFSPDSRTLAVGRRGMEASIYVWEVISGRRRLTLKQSEDVDSLVFSPDGKLLAAANWYITPDWSKSPPPRVHLWDVAAEKELPSL